MKQFLLPLLVSVLKPLEGYKTYIAAGIAALLAANEVLNVVTLTARQIHALVALAGALGLVGLRDYLGRTKPPTPPADEGMISQAP